MQAGQRSLQQLHAIHLDVHENPMYATEDSDPVFFPGTQSAAQFLQGAAARLKSQKGASSTRLTAAPPGIRAAWKLTCS